MQLASLSSSPTNTLNISIKPGFIYPKLYYSNSFINYSYHPKFAKITASFSKTAADHINGECVRLIKQERKLPEGLEDELMPKHVGLIIDGSRRWAVQRGWSPMDGHRAGRMTLKSLLLQCCRYQIKAVSIFLFSTENWNRPAVEVEFMMRLFEDILSVDGEEFVRLGNRVTVMGNRSMLPETLQEVISQVEEKSKGNSGTHVNFAINYSGKYDIIQACKSIARKVKDGGVVAKHIDETLFEQELDTKLIEFPCPDLLIRTSGEIRVSNFMLWQLAYTELHFVKKLFPEFEENDFVQVLHAFQRRRRH